MGDKKTHCRTAADSCTKNGFFERQASFVLKKAQEDGTRLTFMGGFYGCNSFSRGRF